MDIKLINTKTGKVVNVGDTVTDFRGETHRLEAVYPHDGMTGKVQLQGDGFSPLYYPMHDPGNHHNGYCLRLIAVSKATRNNRTLSHHCVI